MFSGKIFHGMMCWNIPYFKSITKSIFALIKEPP